MPIVLAYAEPPAATAPLAEAPSDGPAAVQTPAMKPATIESYPEAALNAGIAHGSATIECIVSDVGSLNNCRVLAEAPSGYGFGDLAIRMSVLFKMRRSGGAGPMGGGTIRIPIRFNRPPGAKPPRKQD